MIIEIGHFVTKCHNVSSPDTAIKLYGNVRLRHLVMICVCKCGNEIVHELVEVHVRQRQLSEQVRGVDNEDEVTIDSVNTK